MNKGQMSLDLLLAFMIAIIFFSILAIHADNMKEDTQEANLQAGLKTTLFDVYTTIGSVKAYGIETNYTSPELTITENNIQLECRITIDTAAGSIKVSSGTLEEMYSGLDMTDIVISTSVFDCGDTVRIQKV